jgi:hypothetical protein
MNIGSSGVGREEVRVDCGVENENQELVSLPGYSSIWKSDDLAWLGLKILTLQVSAREQRIQQRIRAGLFLG